MEISPAYAGKLKMMRNIERYAGSEIQAFLHANWVSCIRIREQRAVNSGICHATAHLSALAAYRKQTCFMDRSRWINRVTFSPMKQP